MIQDNQKGIIVAALFVAAAAALAYFGWKKFQSLEDKLADKPADDSAGTTDMPKATPRAKKVPRRTKRQIAEGVKAGVGMIFGNDGKKAGDVDLNSRLADKIQRHANNLVRADKESGAFLDKMGTTPFINTTVNTILALPDNDFAQVYNAWKATRTFNNVYDTNLFKAKVDNTGIGEFFSRIYTLKLA